MADRMGRRVPRVAVLWGVAGDVPTPADLAGYDGTDDYALFRPSDGVWYIRGAISGAWGMAGDIPVPGDYANLNGTTASVVFRPSNGIWYNLLAGTSIPWGMAGDIPLPSPPAIQRLLFS